MFTLSIETGNAAMSAADDVADALRALADRLQRMDGNPGTGVVRGVVRDVNGNTVGRWSLDED